jgi:diguanylate cyclase (GGDEF)-like protein
MAQGETLGALVLREPCGQTDHLKVASPLATAVGEQISLVMANLSLRISLREQAIRDPLTGLYNRRYLEETLDREVRRAARDRAPLSVVMLDIDHFKKYNDTYGHDGGDAVLCNLAAFLRSEIRAVDIACRFGGEEFTLILPDADADNVLRKLENIRLKAKELVIRHQGRSLPTVTLSMGVAAFPQHGLTGEELLRTADAALYQAKANGRDRVVVAEAVIGSD